MSKTSKILLVAVLSTFMVILDQTIMNTALPHIIAVFNETADRAQLIVSAYLMATAITTPLAPFLADRYGIRKVFMGSQIGFLAGSVLCGISWDIQSLIFFRVLQGLAGGLLVPLSMAFLFVNMPPENRGTAMGVFGIPMLLAPAIGPTLGGYLVDFWSWRVVYYINVPVVIVAFAMAFAWIEDTAIKNTTFDLAGFALASVGFSAILYAFSYAPTWHWDDWRIVTLLIVGCSCILAWVIVELIHKEPMLDLRMLAIRDYAFGIGLSFVTTLGLFSLEFLLPLFLQTLRGLSAFQSGLMVLFQALGAMISMPISGQLYDRIGPRIPAVFGLALMGVTSLWMQVLDVTTPDEMLRIILILRGAGLGMTMMPIMTYALSSVPSSMAAQASSVLTVLRTIVASLGVAIFATLLDGFQKTNLAMMVQTVTPDSPLALRAISQIQAYLMQNGMSLDVAHQEAIVLLYQFVGLRASVTAFDTDYVIGALVILVSIIPAFFLPSGRVKRSGAPAGLAV